MCCAVPCCAMLCHVVPFRPVPCRVVPCSAVPCCAVPCCAVLCRAVPCRAVLCRAVLCCAVPLLYNSHAGMALCHCSGVCWHQVSTGHSTHLGILRNSGSLCGSVQNRYLSQCIVHCIPALLVLQHNVVFALLLLLLLNNASLNLRQPASEFLQMSFQRSSLLTAGVKLPVG